MEDIYCYSFVEDRPSAEVAKKLVDNRNNSHTHKILFREGHPTIKNGNAAIKKKCPALVNMANNGLYSFCLTDLDTGNCAGELIRNWFKLPNTKPISLPKQIVFRVAIREIESWIMADRKAWAKYIGIAESNFDVSPDLLADPKEYLLNIIRRKGRKALHSEMLPKGNASIGHKYNDVLCEFIKDKWIPNRALKNSPSLERAIKALTVL